MLSRACKIREKEWKDCMRVNVLGPQSILRNICHREYTIWMECKNRSIKRRDSLHYHENLAMYTPSEK